MRRRLVNSMRRRLANDLLRPQRRASRAKPVIGVFVTLVIGSALCGSFASGALASPSKSKVGGNLTIAAVGLGWVNLDPINPEDFPTWYEGAPIYNSLFYLQNNGDVSPQLATGYTWEDHNKHLVISLRSNVSFTDGTPFNAQAVAFNLNRAKDPTLASECVPDFQGVTSVVALSKERVQINFAQTNGAMPAFLGSTPCGMMASPTAVGKYGANYGSHPVGTGPFELVSETTNSVIKLKRNPHYWQKGHPYLSTVTIDSVSSPASALDAVESGTAQLMFGTSAFSQQVVAAKRNSNLTILPEGAFISQPIWFNVTAKPFNSLLAREAVTEATDPASIIKTLMYGLAKPTEAMVGSSSWAYPGPHIKGYPTYNLSAAKALVKKLGGLSFTLTVQNLSTGEGSVQEAEALAAQWAQAGIKATVNPLNIVAELADAHSRQYQAMDLQTPGSIEPNTTLYRNLFCTSKLNQTGYCNPESDRLLLAGQEATTVSLRAKSYKALFSVLAKTVPYEYLYAPEDYAIESNSLHGFEPNGTLWLELQNAWLS